MERKIGEIFEFGGEWYQCMKGNTCNDCAFYRSSCGSLNDKGSCRYNFREDATNVIFKKLEKVGEPIEFARGLYFQRYRLAYSTAFYEGDTRLFFNAPTKTFVYIEIKQNEEDMEEDKLNLKPFDIQKAREGKPVCTRDGRKARIICFDRIDSTGCNLTIVALIQVDETEVLQLYHDNGKCNAKADLDLMMLPEKKEGWVNVYRKSIYKTKEDAFNRRDKENYLMTIKVGWEE